MLSLTFIFTFSINNYSQSELTLNNCNDMLFSVSDNTDVDGDFNICESFVTLQNTGTYISNMMCDEVSLNWIITIDLDNDGIDDLEYRSDLPTSDNNLDDTNNNGIPDLYIAPTLNGETQEIELGNLQGPFSTHSIVWKISDVCDVESECEQIIKVIDKKSPIPYCLSLGNILYDGQPDFVVHAEDFNIGTFDNCTSSQDIRVSFSGDSIVPTRLITCDDVINSPISVNVYFWDNQDNIDYCSVYFQVIPTAAADCFPNQFIEGYVKTEKDEPIQNAEVTLNCNLLEFPQTQLTDAEGYYSFNTFNDFVPGCYITVDKPGDYLYNVSTLDLVKILRHIIGLQPFTTPYNYIAADMNNDSSVKASDLFLHRKLVLGVISELPTNTSWKFIDKTFEFSNPSDPWPDLNDFGADPYRITLDPGLDGPYDFIGVKIGNIVD